MALSLELHAVLPRWNGAALSPEIGVFAPPSPFFKSMKCESETEILAEQQPPQGVLVCDHAGLVMDRFSLRQGLRAHVREPTLNPAP